MDGDRSRGISLWLDMDVGGSRGISLWLDMDRGVCGRISLWLGMGMGGSGRISLCLWLGMDMSGSRGISLWLGTISRPIGSLSLVEIKVVMLLLRRVDRLSWVRYLGCFCLGLLLLLGEFNDTASDCFALTFAETALTIVRLWMFVLVEVIISLVNHD